MSQRTTIYDALAANFRSVHPGGKATYMGDPVDMRRMTYAATERILWLKQWLDYGRAIGEVEGFYRDGNPVEEYPEDY